jgi:long-chain-fatty-acid--CoA ligase ACSBG
VCILSFNCPEWFIADVAAIFAGGFACGIYLTSSLEACKFILTDSRANILVVEDAATAEKLMALKPELPMLKKVVQISGQIMKDDPDLIR